MFSISSFRCWNTTLSPPLSLRHNQIREVPLCQAASVSIPAVDAVHAMEARLGVVEHAASYDGCAFRVNGSCIPPWRCDLHLEPNRCFQSWRDPCLLVCRSANADGTPGRPSAPRLKRHRRRDDVSGASQTCVLRCCPNIPNEPEPGHTSLPKATTMR